MNETQDASKGQKVAFLGTGIMGAPMAVNIAKAGYEVAAWNRTPDKAAHLQAKGVEIVSNPARACEDADYVILMLSTGAVVDEVLFSPGPDGVSPAESAPDGATFIIMSSIPMPTAIAQAERLMAMGKTYIDAPVSGGEAGAVNGSLAIMAGGEEDIVTSASPLLSAMGNVTHVGVIGRGQLAKLVNQVIVGISVAAVAEAFVIAESGGIDPKALIKAFQGGFADSTVLQQHGKRIADRNFKPGGQAHIQVKDLVTAEEQARAQGLELFLTPLVRTVFSDMCAHGRADLDQSGVYLELEEKLGARKAGA